MRELTELVLCWCRLTGEDTPSERVLHVLSPHAEESNE
jgi:hypothetical protein